jgi:hypothetical protein
MFSASARPGQGRAFARRRRHNCGEIGANLPHRRAALGDADHEKRHYRVNGGGNFENFTTVAAYRYRPSSCMSFDRAEIPASPKNACAAWLILWSIQF